MEITPRELRDSEIREAFRGYHRDDVNDLLERAASTIEGINERVRQLGERLASVQNDAGRTHETEDILHRTLLLAQRAADEAVAEAQAKARQMVDDAEVAARRVLADAEADARTRGEDERRRLEEEVIDLASRRDALLADVEALTRFEADYRDRMVRALEADLAALRTRPAGPPGPTPETSEVEPPVVAEGILRRDDVDGQTREIDTSALFASEQTTPLVESAGNGELPQEIELAPAAAATSDPAADASVVMAEATHDVPIDLLAAEEALDDDAFFATLRDAVHDDSPLGPRDDSDAVSFFDQDEHDRATFRDVFRRRR